MAFFELDTDVILLNSQQWQELEQKWGEPIDLDTADDNLIGQNDVDTGKFVPSCSDQNLRRTFFDSTKYISKLMQAKDMAINLQKTLKICDEENTEKFVPGKSLYFIVDRILSKESLEDICEEIFKDLESIRSESLGKELPDVRSASISSGSTFSLSLDGSDSEGYYGDVESQSESSHRLRIPKTSKVSLQVIINYINRLFDVLDHVGNTRL